MATAILANTQIRRRAQNARAEEGAQDTPYASDCDRRTKTGSPEGVGIKMC